jgi:hypothetical protein
MKRAISLLGLGAVLASMTMLGGASPAIVAEDDPPPVRYVGVKGCKKCHQKSSIGKQYKVWKDMKHAKAYEQLKSDAAVKLAAKLGLEKAPHESDQCLKCHTTAFGVPKEQLGEKFDVTQGITCEVCHGPGEFFGKPEDKKLHREALGKGYVKPDEALCRSCHNDSSPTWNPERDTTKDGKKVGFDFEARWKAVSHPVPKPEGTK